MKLELTKLVTAISRATDFVEAEILHIPHYHEKRVAILTNAMGKTMGMDEETSIKPCWRNDHIRMA